MSCGKKCLKVKLVEIKLAKSYILVLKEAASGKDQAFTFFPFYQPDLPLEKESSDSPSSLFCGTSLAWISFWNILARERGPQLKINKQTNKQTKNKTIRWWTNEWIEFLWKLVGVDLLSMLPLEYCPWEGVEGEDPKPHSGCCWAFRVSEAQPGLWYKLP